MPINLLYLFYHGEIFEKLKLYIKLLYIQESEGKKLLRVESILDKTYLFAEDFFE